MLNQQGDVLAPIAQRGQMQGKHVQAVEQVAAEFLFFDRAPQIDIGGGDQPHVHPDRLRSSQPLELLVLQNAQQFGLQLQRNISNFVEQQSPLIRQFQSADLLAHRSGEGSLLVAEQLAFQQSRGNGGAVHLDEAALLAPAHVVNHPRYAFFAGPGFPGDQDGGIGVGDGGRVLQYTFQGWAVTDDIVGPVRGADFVLQITLSLGKAVLELRDLAIGMRILERSRDVVGYLLQIFNLRPAESILHRAARIQRSPDPIAGDQGHAANGPNPEFVHGFRHGRFHLSQIVGREKSNVSRPNRPPRECLLNRDLSVPVDERLPLLSVSK